MNQEELNQEQLNKQIKKSEKVNREKANQQAEMIDPDQELLVLEDMDNGNEFFFYQLDAFSLNGQDYICLASYEPDFGDHPEPELVIMRSQVDKKGNRIFKSIRKYEELDEVFEIFYSRMEDSLNS